MADPKGFLTTPRETPTRRPVDVRIQDWREVYEPMADGAVQAQAGRCMDCGIPFCHNGCPLGNLIPEWNDLACRDEWAIRQRAAARDQQLPRVHRPAVPGAVRDGVRARHQRRPGDHQAGRGVDHRPRLVGRHRHAAATAAAVRSYGRGRRLRSRRPGGRAAADPGRAHRRGLRAGRPGRRPAAVRHPRVQDGEGAPGPAAAPDARRGHHVPCRGRTSASTSPAPTCASGTTPSCSRSARPGGAGWRCRARTWPASTRRWSTCRWPTGCRRATWTRRRSTRRGGTS